jgi:hypothetical protein
MRNLRIGQTYQAENLAQILDGEYGTFVVIQGGQVFTAVSSPGHSITSLVPVGARIPTLNVGPIAEQWQVTPISEATDVLGAGRYQQAGMERERRAAGD